MPRACAWIGVAIWERRSSSTSIAAAARARLSSTDSMSASMSAIGVRLSRVEVVIARSETRVAPAERRARQPLQLCGGGSKRVARVEVPAQLAVCKNTFANNIKIFS
eukprot:scaffold18890_cov60-Phaeocystis_antarctica.AAC.3